MSIWDHIEVALLAAEINYCASRDLAAERNLTRPTILTVMGVFTFDVDLGERLDRTRIDGKRGWGFYGASVEKGYLDIGFRPLAASDRG